MSSDLLVSFKCCGGVLKADSLQDGAFSKFFLNGKLRLLQLAVSFKLLCIGKKAVLYIFLRHKMIAA